jgi:hypothetical protein
LPNFPGFSLVRKDRPQGRGSGLAFLIHHLIAYSLVEMSFVQDDHTECQAAKVILNSSDIVIYNVYLPPVSSCPQTYQPNLSSILNHTNEDILVCGDHNTHYEA